jgi:hypothetical protein
VLYFRLNVPQRLFSFGVCVVHSAGDDFAGAGVMLVMVLVQVCDVVRRR